MYKKKDRKLGNRLFKLLTSVNEDVKANKSENLHNFNLFAKENKLILPIYETEFKELLDTENLNLVEQLMIDRKFYEDIIINLVSNFEGVIILKGKSFENNYDNGIRQCNDLDLLIENENVLLKLIDALSDKGYVIPSTYWVRKKGNGLSYSIRLLNQYFKRDFWQYSIEIHVGELWVSEPDLYLSFEQVIKCKEVFGIDAANLYILLMEIVNRKPNEKKVIVRDLIDFYYIFKNGDIPDEFIHFIKRCKCLDYAYLKIIKNIRRLGIYDAFEFPSEKWCKESIISNVSSNVRRFFSIGKLNIFYLLKKVIWKLQKFELLGRILNLLESSFLVRTIANAGIPMIVIHLNDNQTMRRVEDRVDGFTIVNNEIGLGVCTIAAYLSDSDLESIERKMDILNE
ncbi:hypothetical protein AB6C57_22450 [Vibrio splendidus]